MASKAKLPKTSHAMTKERAQKFSTSCKIDDCRNVEKKSIADDLNLSKDPVLQHTFDAHGKTLADIAPVNFYCLKCKTLFIEYYELNKADFGDQDQTEVYDGYGIITCQVLKKCEICC